MSDDDQAPYQNQISGTDECRTSLPCSHVGLRIQQGLIPGAGLFVHYAECYFGRHREISSESADEVENRHKREDQQGHRSKQHQFLERLFRPLLDYSCQNELIRFSLNLYTQ